MTMMPESRMRALAFSVMLTLLSFSARCERATMDLRVIDAETGAPLAGVKVQGEFEVNNGWAGWKSSARPNEVTAVTDTNGCCRLRGETNWGTAYAFVKDPPPGYYPNRKSVKYKTNGKKKFGHWLPKVVNGTIPLQKIGRRIPLAEREPRLWLNEKKKTGPKEPEDGYKVTAAYDLFEDDWLPPHGQGKVADLVFTDEYHLLGVETHVVRGKSETRKSYAWRHTVHVPGKGNGIRPMHPDPLLPIRLRTGVDEELAGSLSRERRCEVSFDGEAWHEKCTGEIQDVDVVYALRLRSEFDESGRLKKAYYARIDGPLDVQPECPEEDIMWIAFRGYLNPLANDRNLEPHQWDKLDLATVRALAKKTHVEVTVPEHDPARAAETVQAAIDECSRGGGGEICVGPGEIEMAPLALRDGVALHLNKGTTLLASMNAAHYAMHRAFISAEDAVDVAICGEGVVDGRDAAFPSGEGLPSGAPDLIRFVRCAKVRVERCLLRNAGAEGIVLLSCDGAKIKGVRYFDHADPSKAGIRIASRNVRIEACEFDTAGDAVVLKPEAESAVEYRDIKVYESTIRCRGSILRLETGKTGHWHGIGVIGCKLGRLPQGMANEPLRSAAIEAEVTDGGKLENFSVDTCDMCMGDLIPFVLRMTRSDPSSGQTPVMRKIFLRDLRGRSESRVACSILGLPDARPESIFLRDIGFTFADGDSEPGLSAAETSPAWGLYIRHADKVQAINVDMALDRKDERPPIVAHDVKGYYERWKDKSKKEGK